MFLLFAQTKHCLQGCAESWGASMCDAHLFKWVRAAAMQALCGFRSGAPIQDPTNQPPPPSSAHTTKQHYHFQYRRSYGSLAFSNSVLTRRAIRFPRFHFSEVLEGPPPDLQQVEVGVGRRVALVVPAPIHAPIEQESHRGGGDAVPRPRRHRDVPRVREPNGEAIRTDGTPTFGPNRCCSQGPCHTAIKCLHTEIVGRITGRCMRLTSALSVTLTSSTTARGIKIGQWSRFQERANLPQSVH